MALSSLQSRARTRDLSQQGARLPRSPGNACHPGPRGHLRTPERRVAGREAARRTGPAAEVRGQGPGGEPALRPPPLRAAALCLLGCPNAKTVPMGENRMRGTGQTARQPSPVGKTRVGTCFCNGSGCPSVQRPAERGGGRANRPPASARQEPRLRRAPRPALSASSGLGVFTRKAGDGAFGKAQALLHGGLNDTLSHPSSPGRGRDARVRMQKLAGKRSI